MPPQLPFDQLSRELMRVLRAERSQREFSKDLGFTSNVVYTWETGRRFPEASVFFKAALRHDATFGRRFIELMREPGALPRPNLTRPSGVHRLVRHLVQGTPLRELAEHIGVDRTTLGRWVHGKTEPRLPDFLRLLNATSQRLLQVVALVTDPESLDATRDAYRDLVLQRRLAYDLPWSHALLRALELDEYAALPKHEPGFLARQIGLNENDETLYLEQLARAGQIRWIGSHWVNQRIMTVDTRQDPKRNRDLKAHWAKVGWSRLQEDKAPEDALFSFNLFAISEESFQKLRQLHLEYFDRVRALIEETPGTDRVVLMNLQLVPLEERKR